MHSFAGTRKVRFKNRSLYDSVVKRHAGLCVLPLWHYVLINLAEDGEDRYLRRRGWNAVAEVLDLR